LCNKLINKLLDNYYLLITIVNYTTLLLESIILLKRGAISYDSYILISTQPICIIFFFFNASIQHVDEPSNEKSPKN